ncbi:MAG: HlyD family secretion protein, partial [Myxococcales bacterium]|nr:HlyD family secretion protein [Myxococcales bacterium]
GVIGDVRVRAGQRIEPGDVVASIVDAGSAVEVVAFLPGGDRPRLAPGQKMRLELDGYRYAYQELVVEVVATEALGPEEARRYLGRIGESVPLRGPVVLVRARLPDEFVADGVPYRYIDGMGGTVEIEVESERVIDALIPGLRRL